MPAPHNPDAMVGCCCCPCDRCLEIARIVVALPPRVFYCAAIMVAREEYRRIFQIDDAYEATS